MKGRTAPWIAGAVGVVVLLLIVVLATRKPVDGEPTSSPLVGQPVPALAGTTLDGERFDIDDHRGKFVLVNFFASWCLECKIEHPELVKFVEEHRARDDVTVVSVTFDDTPELIRDFFSQNGGDWPVIVGDTGGAILDFGVAKVPESFLISPSRQVVAKFIGVTQAELDRVIAKVTVEGGFTTGTAAVVPGPR